MSNTKTQATLDIALDFLKINQLSIAIYFANLDLKATVFSQGKTPPGMPI